MRRLICRMLALVLLFSACSCAGGEAASSDLLFFPGITWDTPQETMEQILGVKGERIVNDTETILSFENIENKSLNRYINLALSVVYNAPICAIYSVDMLRTPNIWSSTSADKTITSIKNAVREHYADKITSTRLKLSDFATNSDIENRVGVVTLGAIGGIHVVMNNYYGEDFASKITDFECWMLSNEDIIVSMYSSKNEYKRNMFLIVSNVSAIMGQNVGVEGKETMISGVSFQETVEQVCAALDQDPSNYYDGSSDGMVLANLSSAYSVNGQVTMCLFYFSDNDELNSLVQYYYDTDEETCKQIQQDLEQKYGVGVLLDEENVIGFRQGYSDAITEVKAWFVDGKVIYLAPALSDSEIYVFQAFLR